jgi:colanic acid/amylovoran biosynthesis glycosyltransferase
MPILSVSKSYSRDRAAEPKASAPSTRKMAYLLSQYPAVSHTFIFNEITQLRKEGFDISTASVNACDRPISKLPESELAEQSATFYLKPAGAVKALQSAIFSTFKYPLGVLRGLFFTLRLGGSPKRLFYFIEALMVGAWMSKKRLTHLHVHFGLAAATAGMIVAKTFPFTYSLTIHGPEEFYDVSKFYVTEKVDAALFICCIGSFARSQLMKVSPSNQWHKFKVVPLGVDQEKFTPSRRLSVAPALPFKAPFEILCVGRLVPAKGQHILVSAVKRLVEENRAVRLRLLGDGPERRSLEERIVTERLTAHVILEGAVNPDRIRDFLRNADVFALSSFAEGIPVALMEAMATEIPCVSTMIAGIPELIRDEIDGLLVPPSDEEALAEALRRLMDEPEFRRRLGRAGRLRVIDRYDLEKNVKALAEVYQCHLP